jgi:hypothetical protein
MQPLASPGSHLALVRLHSGRWRLILVSSQYGSCFMSPFCGLELLGDSQILGNLYTLDLLIYNQGQQNDIAFKRYK